jgi:hypothetical protein
MPRAPRFHGNADRRAQRCDHGQTALAITGISAYSSGFEVFVTQLIRPDAPGYDDDTDPPPYV